MSRARRVLQGSRLVCKAKSVLFSAETSSAAWLRQPDSSWPEGETRVSTPPPVFSCQTGRPQLIYDLTNVRDFLQVQHSTRACSTSFGAWQQASSHCAPTATLLTEDPAWRTFHKRSLMQFATGEPGNTPPPASPAAPSQHADQLGESDSHRKPAPLKSWLDRVLPAQLLPYAHLMRLDKPIGTWLLAWPCFWSIALAAPLGSLPDLRLLALFGTGALLLRGAGCTVNDLWDRDLDAQVERTRSRPLASGALTPLKGLGLLGAQLMLGLGVLVQLNQYSIALGASSLALVFTYPLMKRVTFWPQAYLGLTFNWGALLGYAAVHGACDWPVVLPLYAGGVCWTLVYDTIYAHQDKLDDVRAGVKSTALLFGQDTRPWLSVFAAAATGLWATSGHMAGAGLPFYAGVSAASLHMAWQIWTVDLDSRADCMAKFVSNKWLGGLMFSGIVADKLI